MLEILGETFHGIGRENVLHETGLAIRDCMTDAKLMLEEGTERAMGCPYPGRVHLALGRKRYPAIATLLDHARATRQARPIR